jgi:hypothetical protein
MVPPVRFSGGHTDRNLTLSDLLAGGKPNGIAMGQVKIRTLVVHSVKADID